ncbi:MAG: permease-like cell division protein FtsX [Candidatus Woesebacteria bacterium]
MFRSFATALKTMRRSPYQAMVAILMMTLSFFVAFSFALVLFVANRALQYIETKPQVIAYFDVKATNEQVDSAKNAMQQKPYVAEVKVVTKQDALKIFQEENKKDPLLSDLVSADILPASLEVSATSVDELETISIDLKKIDGVDEVVYQKEVIAKLASWTKTIRQSGLAVTGVLFLITLLLVFVILSLRVAVKRKEIGILNLLGASRWYIRGPFMIEGILYGVIGSVIGWVSSFIVLLYATPAIVGFFGEIRVLPIPTLTLVSLLGGGVLVGLFLGLVSSYLAVARFIRH